MPGKHCHFLAGEAGLFLGGEMARSRVGAHLLKWESKLGRNEVKLDNDKKERRRKGARVEGGGGDAWQYTIMSRRKTEVSIFEGRNECCK